MLIKSYSLSIYLHFEKLVCGIHIKYFNQHYTLWHTPLEKQIHGNQSTVFIILCIGLDLRTKKMLKNMLKLGTRFRQILLSQEGYMNHLPFMEELRHKFFISNSKNRYNICRCQCSLCFLNAVCTNLIDFPVCFMTYNRSKILLFI